jgi:hypothetical protein
VSVLERLSCSSPCQVFVEYVVLSGVNDGSEHAHQLGALLSGRDVVVNLIPWNPVYSPTIGFEAPQAGQVGLSVRPTARLIPWNPVYSQAACRPGPMVGRPAGLPWRVVTVPTVDFQGRCQVCLSASARPSSLCFCSSASCWRRILLVCDTAIRVWADVEFLPQAWIMIRAALQVHVFQGIVRGEYGVQCTVRQEKGQDISGACGQLVLERGAAAKGGPTGGCRSAAEVKDIEELARLNV